MIPFITTPKDRFENLPDYPFYPNYLEVGDGLKIHFVDEGPKDGPIVLLLHGEPSWSFLYRKMIPIFVKAGYRTIAPDLIGFGKSDKPTRTEDYTFARHLAWTTNLVHQLDLQDINLFCQDWGGLIGLRMATAEPDRFACIVAGNTMLPTGDVDPGKSFNDWKNYSQTVPEFPVGGILNKATVTDLSPEVIAAYDAPFPNETYKAGARIFPALVPVTPDDPEAQPNRDAWKVLTKWEKPFLTLFSDSDPIMKGLEKFFIQMIPGAKGQPHKIIEGGGHFLQEDKGEEIAGLMVKFMRGM